MATTDNGFRTATRDEVSRQQMMQAALSAIGDTDDPLVVLASVVADHARNQVSDGAVPGQIFLLKWGVLLGSPVMVSMAKEFRTISGFVNSPRHAVDAIKGISLYKFLRNVDIFGGK